ncbi:MAG: DUF6576 domain-containing protein [Verrucomicrobiota bacterium]
MRTTSSFSDYQPLGYLGRLPLHITTLLAALYLVGMVVAQTLNPIGTAISGFSFVTSEFYGRGWVWEAFTHTFVNSFSIFFLFAVYCFYSAGIEVERYLGRARFVKFFALSLLVVPVTLGLWKLAGFSTAFQGINHLFVAMFVAFGTLYPNIEYLSWIRLKHVVMAICIISGLLAFWARDWVGLSVLAAEGATAFGFIRYLQHGGALEFGDLKEKLFGPRRNFRVLPPPERSHGSEADDVIEEIDPLLEKIAKSGLASLSRQERAKLEKARQALINKETPER